MKKLYWMNPDGSFGTAEVPDDAVPFGILGECPGCSGAMLAGRRVTAIDYENDTWSCDGMVPPGPLRHQGIPKRIVSSRGDKVVLRDGDGEVEIGTVAEEP